MQQQHRNLMTRRMNAGAAAAMQGVDAIVMVIDAVQGLRPDDQRILNMLPKPHVPDDGGEPVSHVVLVLSKVDALKDRAQLLPLMQRLSGVYPFNAIVPVSASKAWQLDDLLSSLRKLLPVGQPLFEADDITDRSVRFLAAELVREQAFRLLGDELPYGLAVVIENWEESEGRAVISALIQVERESQRGIVIGAGGAKLRDIGSRARVGIQRLLGKPVFLETHVRVANGWSDDARALDRLGVEAIRS
jgi:GTP-binding protein Era